MSGLDSSSHSRSRGRRLVMPLTLKVAIFSVSHGGYPNERIDTSTRKRLIPSSSALESDQVTRIGSLELVRKIQTHSSSRIEI